MCIRDRDCHENKKDGSTFRNAATGEVLFQVKSSIDVGRCRKVEPSFLFS